MDEVEQPGRRRQVRRFLFTVSAVALVAALLWAVEVGSPRTVDATGVDELPVPLGDLSAVDFVSGVDHPWLPLLPGARWVHRGETGDRTTTVRTEVLTDTVRVSGVEATQVRTTYEPGGDVEVRLYAQDADGHVWLLGEEPEGGDTEGDEIGWRAGDGVPAGLAMPAEPRRGDGFVRVPAAVGADPVEWWTIGEAEDGDTAVTAGEFTDLLLVTETGLGDGAVATYDLVLARGIGEVRRTYPGGVLELVEHRPGVD